MFKVDTSPVQAFIDTFQNAKLTAVDTVVLNKEIKKPLETFINAQTSFAKKVVEETATFWDIVSNLNVDYSKAFASK